MIFDDELGAGFEAWKFTKGIKGHADVWADAEKGLFGNGFGDAGVYLPGDGDDVFRPREIGEGNELEIAYGLPAEVDAVLAENGIVPAYAIGDQEGVMDDNFNGKGLDDKLGRPVNGIVDGIYFNRGVFEC